MQHTFTHGPVVDKSCNASRGLRRVTRLLAAARQVSGMAGARHPVDLPEGYHTPARGQSFTTPAAGCVEGWPPGRRAVGLRQVDGMPREPGSGLAEQTRSEPPASGHHAPRRTSRNTQANRYATAPGVSSREPVSAFGTKRSQVQILSPRPDQTLSTVEQTRSAIALSDQLGNYMRLGSDSMVVLAELDGPVADLVKLAELFSPGRSEGRPMYGSDDRAYDIDGRCDERYAILLGGTDSSLYPRAVPVRSSAARPCVSNLVLRSS